MRITKVHLHATNSCTNNCRHCSVNAGPDGTTLLNDADFRYIVDWSSAIGARIIEISGGEPLVLGEELLEVIRYADDSGLAVVLLTNGCLLDKGWAQKLASANTASIGISIYGANPRTHEDFTRTPDSFYKTIEGIKNASAAGLEVTANVVVTPKNIEELQLLPSILDGQVSMYTFASVVPSGRGAKNDEYILPEDSYEQVIEGIMRCFSSEAYCFLNSMFPEPSQELQRYCLRPVSEIVIDHLGHLIPCCLLPQKLRHQVGDVKRRDLQETIMENDPAFLLLSRGHKEIRNSIKYDGLSHNLCKTCIEMLDISLQTIQTR